VRTLTASNPAAHDLVRGRLWVALLPLLAALPACSGQDRRPMPAAAPPPSSESATSGNAPAPAYAARPGLNASRRLAVIYDLLNQGRVDPARIEIARLMSDYPDDKTGPDLLRQIEQDPKTLYGADSFAYEARPGDTFASLASRFLGAGSRFYGLARYNGVAIPSALTPGQTVMIPGKFRAPAPVREPRRPRFGRSTPPAAPGTAAPAAPAATPQRTDPARAANLRRAGLERMATGSIGRAVQLLQRAAALDPANPAIAADLDRARRIQSSVDNRP
jgi:hypothetical protein